MLTMDDVSTTLCVVVSIKIAHGDFKYCPTHVMSQMMVNMIYRLFQTVCFMWCVQEGNRNIAYGSH